MSFGLSNIPNGAFNRACMATINIASPMLTGILSKILLAIKIIALSIKVKAEMLIMPNRGVHVKNLLYMKEEK